MIHRFWLEKYKLEGDYKLEAVIPEAFDQFVNDMPGNGFCGGNVTLPHKERALQLCDRTSELGRRIGAVNTLWFENGRLCGDNTDVSGFLANLDEQAPGWARNCQKAVIVGAGGATRAVLAGLIQRKVESVTILNRSVDRARRLADEARTWGAVRIEAAPLDESARRLAGTSLLVNSTSLGMAGQDDLTLDLSTLPDDAVACDIVYTPLQTGFLKAAQARGLRICSGLGMLLHQAAPGFEHWFGVRPEISPELRALIELDIQRGAA
jgi:shikimate dehydrogenase